MFFLSKEIAFPPAHLAGEHGLLAIGGDLSVERLIFAYKKGVFPWFNEGEPIVWYTPNPRMVLFPEQLKISKSMRKFLKSNSYRISFNENFEQVILNCKTVTRKGQEDTWITDEMLLAYIRMHRAGYAKSFEVWNGQELIAGLYGVELDGVFCGESMFTKVSNCSKLAFIHMVEHYRDKGFKLIDCQVYNEHLSSLGAVEISRDEFLNYLK